MTLEKMTRQKMTQRKKSNIAKQESCRNNQSRRYSSMVGLASLVLLGLSFSLSASAQDQDQDYVGKIHQQTFAADTQTQTTTTTTIQATTPPDAADEGGFHLSLSPYLWFAGSRGTVGALGRDTGVHASAGDLLDHLDIGLMGAAEARYNRFVLSGDMIWIRVSDSKAVPFPALGATSADVRVGQFIWTSKLGYRVINAKRFKADANVGVRYWHLGQTLNFNPSALGLNFNGSQSWADVLVGGRVQLPMGRKVVIDLLGDVGGWDASAKLDYQFATLLTYKFCPKWAVTAGYRYLFIDYRPTNLSVYNTITSGGLIGITYTFK